MNANLHGLSIHNRKSNMGGGRFPVAFTTVDESNGVSSCWGHW